jgi:hypothetical protein
MESAMTQARALLAQTISLGNDTDVSEWDDCLLMADLIIAAGWSIAPKITMADALQEALEDMQARKIVGARQTIERVIKELRTSENCRSAALASRPTTPEAQLAEKMPRDVHQLDEWIAEAYQEGYAEGQGDATNVHSEFCQTMWQWLDDRNLLGEPEADPPGYTATQMMDSVYAHENALAGIIDDLQAVVRARDAKIAKATEVLKFYGERDNYAPRESDITQSWINCDDGIRARSVLAEMEGKT